MGRSSTGRGTAAIFGSLILLAGLVGAAVLFYTAQRRPDRAIDEFARAPVGCTTTLEFTDTGRFFVFQETGPGPAQPLGDCEPAADPDRSFGFVLSDGDGPVEGQGDLGISYDTGDRAGQSVASFVVDEPGRYEIEVVGDDLAVVAAIGRDPDDGVAALRRAALIVGGIGVVLGSALLLLARRRSEHAAPVPEPSGAIAGPGTAPVDWGRPPVGSSPVHDSPPPTGPATVPPWPPAPSTGPTAGGAPPPPPPPSSSPPPSPAPTAPLPPAPPVPGSAPAPAPSAADTSAPPAWAPPASGPSVEHPAPTTPGSAGPRPDDGERVGGADDDSDDSNAPE